MADRRFAFGAFLLDEHGALLRDGAPVVLSARAIALLRALLEADGEPVTKAALMDAAWPGTSVEESNLTVQIAALRKVLGASDSSEDWIATVPRIGYRLVRTPAAAQSPADRRQDDDKPSIAVLPFTNMSSDPEQGYFADGLAEDLISDLSRVPGLLVIARNSSFTYKGQSVNLRTAATELGVRYIVEGSVRRSVSRVRVSAQLIDTVDNRHMWVDRFDRDIADVFALQDEIVGRIVNALGDVLPSVVPVPSRRAVDLEAYDLLVRGRLLGAQSPDGNRIGRAMLQRAAEIEPNFPELHAWLALSHVWSWVFWGDDMATQGALARAASERAIALDPQGTAARWVLGYVKAHAGDLPGGIAEFDTTLRHNPNNVDAWIMRGELKVLDGRPLEGIADLDQALRLNPFPGSAYYYWVRGFAEYGARRYEDAVRTLSNDLMRHTVSQRILAAALGQLGRMDEARAVAAEFMAENPHFTITKWANIEPFANQADCQHYIDGYLKVGLPL